MFPVMNTYNIATYFSIIFYSLCLLLFPLTCYLVQSNLTIITTWVIVNLNTTEIIITIAVDIISCIFRITVLFISANVLLFAKSYIERELFLKRFITLVVLFVFSINLLIFIPNLITLLIGWDGLGITSFILVIYYQNPKSLGAGIITALSNRIGDVIILLSVALLINTGHWDIISILYTSDILIFNIAIIILMLAGITKSAQIPFSRWLPAAIAAPTPVSALVHSSTLVTAGVFLLIRFYPFLANLIYFNYTLLILSSLTITIAGMAAIVETDIKKIIALSTLRQLGVIISRVAINLPLLAFYHLVTHALFKALLFICAGTLIHSFYHSQDMRYIGQLSLQIPLTTTALLSANLALCGFPFIAGFYSKDLIIEITLFRSSNGLISILYIIATILTVAYSIRFSINVIYSSHISPSYQYTSDEDTFTTTPIIFLSLGAIIGGRVINWIILDPIPHPNLPTIIKISPIIILLIAITITFIIITKTISTTKYLPMLAHSNAWIWFLTPISSQGIINKGLAIGHELLKSLDQRWVETSGAQGIKLSTINVSSISQLLGKNIVTIHLLLILLALPILIIYFSSL